MIQLLSNVGSLWTHNFSTALGWANVKALSAKMTRKENLRWARDLPRGLGEQCGLMKASKEAHASEILGDQTWSAMREVEQIFRSLQYPVQDCDKDDFAIAALIFSIMQWNEPPVMRVADAEIGCKEARRLLHHCVQAVSVYGLGQFLVLKMFQPFLVHLFYWERSNSFPRFFNYMMMPLEATVTTRNTVGGFVPTNDFAAAKMSPAKSGIRQWLRELAMRPVRYVLSLPHRLEVFVRSVFPYVIRAIVYRIYAWLAGVSAADMIRLNLSDKVFQPAFAVMVDHESKSVVLAIRGTSRFFDFVTDGTCRPITVYMRPSPTSNDITEGYAHEGMMYSAEYVASEARRDIIYALSQPQNKGYNVVVTGHSLGAGTAALTSAILRGQLCRDKDGLENPPATTPPIFQQTRAYCYAITATLSLNLCGYMTEFMTAVVADGDIVPRLSLASVLDLRNCLYTIIKEKPETVRNVKRKMKGLSLASGLMVAAGVMRSEAASTLTMSQLRSNVMTQGKNGVPMLYPPGRIIHVTGSDESLTGPAGLLKVDKPSLDAGLGEIYLWGWAGVLIAHFPPRYIANIKRLVKAAETRTAVKGVGAPARLRDVAGG